MHGGDFAHRDIDTGVRPMIYPKQPAFPCRLTPPLENILIKPRPPDGSWWVKLSDFGISKRSHPSAEQLSIIKGAASWTPPEAFGHKPWIPVVIDQS